MLDGNRTDRTDEREVVGDCGQPEIRLPEYRTGDREKGTGKRGTVVAEVDIAGMTDQEAAVLLMRLVLRRLEKAVMHGRSLIALAVELDDALQCEEELRSEHAVFGELAAVVSSVRKYLEEREGTGNRGQGTGNKEQGSERNGGVR